MNKYKQAYNVIDTVLHLMCGEEREDGYKPTQKEMIEAMDSLKELVEKSKNIENLEYVREEIERAYEFSEKATDLNNKTYALWFGDCTPTFEKQSQIISCFYDQLHILWALDMLLNNLITNFEYDFRLINWKR